MRQRDRQIKMAGIFIQKFKSGGKKVFELDIRILHGYFLNANLILTEKLSFPVHKIKRKRKRHRKKDKGKKKEKTKEKSKKKEKRKEKKD